MRYASFIALSLSASSTLLAQTAPPKRAHHSLVYDEAGKRVLLWGGSSPFEGGNCCAMFNDLWSFDGTRWTSLGKTGPEASGIQLAYDNRQNRVVGFGGYIGGGGSLGDLRALQDDKWASLGRHPEFAVAEPGFVYDSRRNRFVTFGGSSGRGVAQGNTWEWDGTAWHKIDVAGPPARQAHVMVFDARRNVVVLFGGAGVAPQGQQPARYTDTWEYDGRSWTEIGVSGPSSRMAAGATFDSKRGVVVMFGGFGADSVLGDTWTYDGHGWRRVATSGPDARGMGYLAYDHNRERVVMFGGRKGWPNDLNDTWEWDGTVWKKIG